MPVLYDYLGIKIGFYSNEHEPIHVHAVYNRAVMKVVLHAENGVVHRVSYKEEVGDFNKAKLADLKKAKLADLKKFISKNKNALYFAWVQFFQENKDNNVKIKTITISKKIK